MAPAIAFLLVVIGGCRTTVGVEITQDDTGGGTLTATLTVDPDALEALGGPEVVLLDDLSGTAWQVSERSTSDEGGLLIQATRDFTDADTLQTALDELAPGVFSNVRSDVRSSFATTEHNLSLDVAVSGDLAQFSDDALTETLGGNPVGYTPDELKLLGADQPGVATMEVVVSVPGGEPDDARFDLATGGAQNASLSSTSEDRDSAVITLAIVGAALVGIGLLAGLVFLVWRPRRRV
ncbi:MAG: hypothetical protein ACK5O2_06005 [Microthrixaceae bacterium]